MRNVRTIGAAISLFFVASSGAACGGMQTETPGPKAPGDGGVTSPPSASTPGAVEGSPIAAGPEGEGAGVKPTPPGPFACRLPAPVSSDDTCVKDADCAPAEPCHARACVAASKARPRAPDTVCTMNVDCSSADVNRCACYEGRCALVPESH